MVVGAQVGAADHRDDEIGVLPDLLVADGRLQQMRVILDPALEIQGRAVGGMGTPVALADFDDWKSRGKAAAVQ